MEVEKITGIIEEVENCKLLKQGRGKKGPWTLWGSGIIVNGQRYGLSDFNQENLENKICFLAIGDKIEFQAEQNGQYWNIPQDFEVKVLSHGNAPEKKVVPSKLVPEQKTLALFSDEEIVKKSLELSRGLLSEVGEKELATTMTARLTVFEQLMLDRRTNLIEEFKRQRGE